MDNAELKAFLDEKTDQYNRPGFLKDDPVGIPHAFSQKEDIEIAGFLAATIAWGQRVTIIRNAERLMELMGGTPHDFILNHSAKDRLNFDDFKHRTFNGVDAICFMEALQNLYKNCGGLEAAFGDGDSVGERISNFKQNFFALPHPERTRKHVSDPAKKSSAKRLNMFLRWMVRHDARGVDFGLWHSIKPSQLYCPLDIHTGNVGRKLGLLKRKQNDWLAVEELTCALRQLDPIDPVKYDFALFGLGVFEGF